MGFAVPSAGQVLIPGICSTDDQVYAIAHRGNTVYLGGLFTRVGRETGGGVPLDALTGSLRTPFDAGVDGGVRAVAPDGEGGWFIGGSFTAVGGLPRVNLAHVLEDGTVDKDWDPGTGGPYKAVYAITRSGGTLYVAGEFDSIGGCARHCVAALDAASGEVTSWDAGLSGGNYYHYVYAVAVAGGVVYVGGGFTHAGGLPRARIAAIDSVNGQPTVWNPGLVGTYPTVYALAVAGDLLYVGGAFSGIAGKPCNGVAALDLATGDATAWAPEVRHGAVRALLVSGGIVYLGGQFDQVGTQIRNRLAAVDSASGEVTAWDPNPNGYVFALAKGEGVVYAGGGFSNVGGQPRRYLAAIDPSGAATPTDPRFYANANGGWTSETVSAIAVDNGTLYAGGSFYGVDARDRAHLAAFDAISGNVTDWNPGATSTVFALAADDSVVYVGGYFNTIGGVHRPCLAAVDARDGHVLDWDAPLAGYNLYVNALALRGGTLYVGGSFTSLAGQPRTCLAALDAATGAVTGWDPRLAAGPYYGVSVQALAAGDGFVVVGGEFGRVGARECSGLAVVDSATAIATAWNEEPNVFVRSIALHDPTAYVAGDFGWIGGAPRNCLAAIDTRSGLATSWDPQVNDEVDAVAVCGGSVFVGGLFSLVGGAGVSGFAALDETSGALQPWSPRLEGGYVQALATSEVAVYAGGAFWGVDRQSRHCLFALVPIPSPLRVTPPASGPGIGLSPPAPNPARETVRLHLSLAREAVVSLEVLDVQGRRIATPVDHALWPAGRQAVVIETARWRPGYYVIRLTAGEARLTRRLVVIR